MSSTPSQPTPSTSLTSTLADAIRLSDVVSALSFALDLTEGQLMGHAVRTCFLGMRIADELKLSQAERSSLYYALLLKDAGCSTNAARMHHIMGSDDIQVKREVKFEDWTKPSISGLKFLFRNVMPNCSLPRRILRMVKLGAEQKRNNAEMIGARCERGANIARKIGMDEATAQAIHALDEHWDGGGYPGHRSGQDAPLLARILNVSQTVEVFHSARGRRAAIDVVTDRSGTWFDPELVRVVRRLEKDETLWAIIASPDVRAHVLKMEPGIALPASPERIDSICAAFAEVIDAKSPYTYSHSMGVAEATVTISESMGLSASVITMMRRAALLHDIGKLSVPNSILEKPGKLTAEEWNVMKAHPVFSREIIQMISGFQNLAFVAGAHHERLDGKGYPNGLTAAELPLTARILCVADVYQALSEKRPYREGLAPEVVFGIMDKDASRHLDAECIDALKRRVGTTHSGESKSAAASGK